MKKTNTKLSLLPLTLGTWAFAGGTSWGKQDVEDSIRTVQSSIELGIVSFDTAPGYGEGRSEEVLGKAIAGHRDEVVIATKVSRNDLSRDRLIKSCEESLRRLNTDHIDLLQIHWPSVSIPMEETIEALNHLKEIGKIGRMGVCNFSKKDMQAWALAGGEMFSNQLPYSLLTRAIEFEILPECHHQSVEILAYSPLMQGLLTGKFHTADEVPEGRARSRHFNSGRPAARHGEPGCEEETFVAINRIGSIAADLGLSMESLSLAWVLHKLGQGSVIVGARNPQQVAANAAALRVELDEATCAALDEATSTIKELLGKNPDIWESSPGRYNL